MPENKRAFTRLRIIDACLRDFRRKWSKKDIFNKVNSYLKVHYGEEAAISQDLIRHDLDFLKSELTTIGNSVSLDLYQEEGSWYYKYSDPEFSFWELPLSEMDNARLTRALETLRSIRGLEISEELQSIIENLQNRTLLKSDIYRKVIQFDHAPVASGNDLIDVFLTSINEKRPLIVNYKRFSKDKPVVHHFHPYLLKEHNNRWFCIGYSSSFKQLHSLGLDRVEGKVKNLHKEKFIDNVFFDTETYFNDIIGVTHPGKAKRQLIQFEISKDRYPYIKSKPLHHSQQIVDTQKNGNKIMTLEVVPNNELMTVLLSFGGDLVIQKPDSLIKKAKDSLKKSLTNYSKKL